MILRKKDQIKRSFLFVLLGYNTSHDRNENSSPPSSTMHPPQLGGQQSPANLSYMHMANMHRNATSGQSVNYHLQNMKEEPSSGASNYSNMGSTQDNISVSQYIYILNRTAIDGILIITLVN